VFNNVEISETVKDSDKQKIYEKYILGVKKFAEAYNSKNPKKPLKQINVGMHYNDLQSQIYTECYPTQKLLKSLNYGLVYGKENKNYNGDSDYNQYILWENDGPEL